MQEETSFKPLMNENENHFAEAQKYELLGLRSEMIQYMHHSFLVENYSLTAAAVVFSFTLTFQPETIGAMIAALILCVVPLAIVYFGYERVRLLRYRISRLGLYIMLREKSFPNRPGWEHFVYQFRQLDMENKATRALEIFQRKPNPTERARALNEIIQEIDDHPGDFTGSAIRRWKLILWSFGVLSVLNFGLIIYKWNTFKPKVGQETASLLFTGFFI